MISKEDKPNFERINYSLRPAKHTERKMFCEALSRLNSIESLTKYRYIGMGSAYFTDFSLFHKNLGIKRLISIESEKEYRKRIYFNRPYSCIKVKFGLTNEVLPYLPWHNWKEKSIVWLDYTQPLMRYMLGDIDIVVQNIRPGSVFMISVNIEKAEQNNKLKADKKISDKEYRLRNLEQNVGKHHIPLRAYNMNLNVENNKSIIREIINNVVLDSIIKRFDQVKYKQLFNIYYKDSADMLTVGGIIFNEEQKNIVDENFDDLDFIRSDESCFNIIIPKLTFKEIFALDKTLPDRTPLINAKKRIPLSEEDITNYSNIYRYFPAYTEINL